MFNNIWFSKIMKSIFLVILIFILFPIHSSIFIRAFTNFFFKCIYIYCNYHSNSSSCYPDFLSNLTSSFIFQVISYIWYWGSSQYSKNCLKMMKRYNLNHKMVRYWFILFLVQIFVAFNGSFINLLCCSIERLLFMVKLLIMIFLSL